LIKEERFKGSEVQRDKGLMFHADLKEISADERRLFIKKFF
jgi:hypothetical protein